MMRVGGGYLTRIVQTGSRLVRSDLRDVASYPAPVIKDLVTKAAEKKLFSNG